MRCSRSVRLTKSEMKTKKLQVSRSNAIITNSMNSKMMMQATIQNINISPQLNYSIEKIQEMVQEMARMITVALQQWAEADSPDLKAKARCQPKN
jgi:hypothetical protein